MIGKTFSNYEVVEKIGAGGMGEVFRARDTKLGRDVALKFLPDSLSHDPDRLARFDREAKLLASLNHPYVASIHGFEHVDGKHFLVLEMIDGEDLAERLTRGPIPVDETLRICLHVAEALEAAHEEGIVHRDLKPGNIKVSSNDTVKVLDFGLAKAWDSEPSSSDLSQSPTVLGNSPTLAGVILGTAAYMSPEQARGKNVDKRADIFGFGCVLYEMLTGKQMFAGDTVSDTLASILKSEPDWDALPSDTPRAIKRLLRRCLEKDPARRLRDIGEARIVIDSVIKGETTDDIVTNETVALQTSGRSKMAYAGWGLLAVVAVVSSLFAFTGFSKTSPSEMPVMRTSILPPDGVRFSLRGVHPGPVVISPDGRRVVFTGRQTGGKSLLFVRELDSTEARALIGTDNAGYPFWSPDGQSIGFFADGKLKRVDISGAPPLALCEAPVGKGGAWNEDGTIVFAPSFATPLHSVPAVGGISTPITEMRPDEGENSHRFPQFLPDGDHFIYFARLGGEVSAIRLSSVSGDEDREVMRATSNVVYASEQILFLRQSTLMSRPFDPDKLGFTGDPVPVADPVRFIPGAMRGIFDASADGMLVYQAGSSIPGAQLVWRDLDGKRLGSLGDIVQQDNYSISPDGTKVAVDLFDKTGGTTDIWIYDVAREIRSRFTFDSGNDSNAIWSPDGSQIVFTSTRSGKGQLYIKNVGGATNEEPLIETPGSTWPTDWSMDGRYVVYFMNDSTNTGNVWALPLFGDQKPFPVVSSGYSEYNGLISPDGNWMAYVSDESGTFDVYVTSFPEAGRKWQISSGGSVEPRWDPKGRGIYYFSLNDEFHFVETSQDASTFAVGAARLLFESNSAIYYRTAPDGERLLVLEDADEGGVSPLTLVTNWTRDLVDRRKQ